MQVPSSPPLVCQIFSANPIDPRSLCPLHKKTHKSKYESFDIRIHQGQRLLLRDHIPPVMGHTRAITVSVAVIVILIAIGYAMHLDEERGKDEFVFDWGPGTTMEYRASGGYTGSDAGYDVSYIFDGGTQKDVIVSITATDFTYTRAVTMKITHIDPITGEIRTTTQSGERTYTQDRTVRIDDCESSTLETKWGTKNVLIIRSVVTDDNGNKINLTDYRDESTFIRLKAEVTCDDFKTGSYVLRDWHMTYTLTGYELK